VDKKRQRRRNIDVIVGLAYVGISMEIMHAQRGAESIEHLYANILLALYFLELCRPFKSLEYMRDAATIMQEMILQ
jgi:hypothetical protein